MPSTGIKRSEALKEAQGMFLRSKGLTDEEKAQIMELIRQMIKPHLNTATLSSLGELNCGSPSHYHNCTQNAPEVESDSEDLTLEVQGIFSCTTDSYPLPDHEQRFYSSDGRHQVKYIWGITRSNEWILVEVIYLDLGRKILVKKVRIMQSNPEEILRTLNTRFYSIIVALSNFVYQYAKRRKELYQQAQDLSDGIHTILDGVSSLESVADVIVAQD